MCLSVVYRGKQRRESLAKLPEKFYCWKYLSYHPLPGESLPFTTPVAIRHVHAGEMKADYLGPAYNYPYGDDVEIQGKGAYKSGWHAYVAKCRPRDYNTKCWAEKKHIRAIGEQGGKLCVVLSHITFPAKCGKPEDKR